MVRTVSWLIVRFLKKFIWLNSVGLGLLDALFRVRIYGY